MQPDRLGTAQWANPDEFAAQHPFEGGKFWLGRSVISGQPLGHIDDRHICLVAGSRVGKGASHIIPNLCKWPGSVVVVDPKGENATVTAVRRGPGSENCDGLGQATHVLDPFRVAQVPDELRASFNPLDALDPSSSSALRGAELIADSIVIKVADAKDPIWQATAHDLVRTLILHVITSPEYEGRRNLITVRELLLSGDSKGIAELEAAGENVKDTTGQHLLWHSVSMNPAFGGKLARFGESNYAMLSGTAKTFEGARRTAITETAFLDVEEMEECLSTSTFQLGDLKTDENGVSLFLSLPQHHMSTHFRWLRMMLSLITVEMQVIPGQPACGHRVLMCMDEFAGLQHMEVIENAVAQIAGFGVKMFFVIQDLEQLQKTYPNGWKTLLSNCGLKLFYGLDPFDGDYLSKALGETEVSRTTRSQNRSTGEILSTTESENTSASTSRNTSTGDSWNEGESRGQTSGGGRSTNAKGLPLFMGDTLRNTGALLRAVTGKRQAGTSKHWGTNEGSSNSRGGSSTASEGTAATTGTGSARTRGSNTSESEGQNETLHKRALITPDELSHFFKRQDDTDDLSYPGLALVHITGEDPAYVRRTNYFEDLAFVREYEPHPDHPNAAATRTTLRPCDEDYEGLLLAASGHLWFDWHVKDGQQVDPGQPLCTIHGFGPLSDYIREEMNCGYDPQHLPKFPNGFLASPNIAPDFHKVRLLAPATGLVFLTDKAKELYRWVGEPGERDGSEPAYPSNPAMSGKGPAIIDGSWEPDHFAVHFVSVESPSALQLSSDVKDLHGHLNKWREYCSGFYAERIAKLQTVTSAMTAYASALLLFAVGALVIPSLRESLGGWNVLAAIGAVVLGIAAWTYRFTCKEMLGHSEFYRDQNSGY